MFKRLGLLTMAAAGVFALFQPVAASAQQYNYGAGYTAPRYYEPYGRNYDRVDREWRRNDFRENAWREQRFGEEERRENQLRRQDLRARERWERQSYRDGYYGRR